LQVYDLGQDGQGMARVTSLSQNAIVSAAGSIARYICSSYTVRFPLRPIVSQYIFLKNVFFLVSLD